MKDSLKDILGILKNLGVNDARLEECTMGGFCLGSFYIIFSAPAEEILQNLHQHIMESKKANTDAIQMTMMPLFLAKVDRKITNLVHTEQNNSLKKQNLDEFCDLLVAKAKMMVSTSSFLAQLQIHTLC